MSSTTAAGPDLAFGPSPEFARTLDAADPLSGLRSRFELPARDGRPLVYLAGHSLGPLPTEARQAVERATNQWASLGVEAWFEESDPWYGIDERFLPALARLVGAHPGEVAVMNGLSVNLHLLLATFFRPRGRRASILIERPAFPSDRFVVETHLRWHGLDPESHLLEVGSPDGSDRIEESDIETRLEDRGRDVALVLLGGVNFLTGQWLDIPRIAEAARRHGAVVGFDLAHAVGNVELALHDWDVDFAAWCHYKYVNAGPGAPAGVFVHERHARRPELGRLGGWWGNDPATRFRMQLDPEFRPRSDAAGWQLSTPSVLSMAPLGPALALFDAVGMERIRARSVRLTAYLEWLIEREFGKALEILTPREPGRRGALLSLRLPGRARPVLERLERSGVVADLREPDVIRMAPAPLYSRFEEVWRAATVIGEAIREVE